MNKEHVVLTKGDVAAAQPLLARVHSECLTGDAMFSLRCDCGSQLQAALEARSLAVVVEVSPAQVAESTEAEDLVMLKQDEPKQLDVGYP